MPRADESKLAVMPLPPSPPPVYQAVANNDQDLSLLHSPADILRAGFVRLETLAWPETAAPVTRAEGAWPAYVGAEPAEPANCVTLYDTSPVVLSRGRYRYGVQLRVRSNEDAVGRAKAEQLAHTTDIAVYRLGVTLDGIGYCIVNVSQLGVIAAGPPLPANKRSLYTLNLMARIRRVT